MPRRTDGSYGPEARHVEETVKNLRARFPDVEVVVWDERFTTVIANRALLEANVSRAGRKRAVDKVAAAVLLQNYLDFEGSKNSAGNGERGED
jgi:putative Holliday junction resolvase